MEMLTPECKYPFLVFDDVVQEEELNDVYDEINYLQKFARPPQETSPAYDINGKILKSNSGIFLYKFYNLDFLSDHSFIVKNLRKIFSFDVQKAIRNYNPIFSHFIPDNLFLDGQLLSIYSDGDYYAKHCDQAIYTCILWIHKEPKNFEGGEFFFHFEDGSVEEVEVKNNRMVLFPSFYLHEVKEIKLLDNDFPRCAISTFLNINY